jgi:predicted ATP-dependent serine protease
MYHNNYRIPLGKKRNFFYCKNCGFISDIAEYCGACQDTNQICFGEFYEKDEAYGYFHTVYKKQHRLNY